MRPPTDTIFALSSGGLPSGVAVIRISGPRVRDILGVLTGTAGTPRRARLCDIRHDGEVLDRGIVLFCEGPSSFTGEDCAELHLHGSRAVVAAVLGVLASYEGTRIAEAGEFTRRAFVNGKVDLVQAEALADLIAAETQAQRRLALANAGGAQTALYLSWRSRLLSLRAEIEAELDFSDQEDVSEADFADSRQGIEALSLEIHRYVERRHAGEIVRDGFTVAIVGRPNAGKSTLLNALVGRDAAIVTEHPGTTRDPIRVEMEIDGNKVILSDTAGLRETEDPVELIGIERARTALQNADLVVELIDLSNPVRIDPLRTGGAHLMIGAKADLAVPETGAEKYDFTLSARTGEGMDVLLGEIGRLASAAAPATAEVLPTSMRQLSLLGSCAAALDRAQTIPHGQQELVAEELRHASDCLGRLVGLIDAEEVLGEIFGRFCIGK